MELIFGHNPGFIERKPLKLTDLIAAYGPALIIKFIIIVSSELSIIASCVTSKLKRQLFFFLYFSKYFFRIYNICSYCKISSLILRLVMSGICILWLLFYVYLQ